MLRINATPKSRAELDLIVNPVNARQPEAIPYVYFDTQTYTTAGGATLQYFAATNTDKTLSNLEQSGTIPDPYYFEIVAFNLDWLQPPSNATAGAAGTAPVGTGNDLELVLKSARAVWVFTLAGKEYLRVPATYLHCSGGALTFSSEAGAAATQNQFTQNSFPDGGFYVDKKIVIPPKQSFNGQLQFQPTAVAIATATNIRISMAGVLHRRVL